MTETANDIKKNDPVELSLFNDTEQSGLVKVDESVRELFHAKSTFLLHRSPKNPFEFEEIGMRDFMAWVFERRGVKGFDVEPYEEKGSHEYQDIWRPQRNAKKIDYSGYGIWRYNPVALYRARNRWGKLVNMHSIILKGDYEQLDILENRIFAIISPITYVGRNRYAKNARYLYAFVIDLDGVGMPQMRDMIYQQRSDLVSKHTGEPLGRSHSPVANIIVNSGNGLHMYYLLEHPVALYKENVPLLRKMKTGLTNIVWNEFTSNLADRQYQGIYQGFRMPGTLTKFGEKIRAFRNRDVPYHTLQDLNEFLTTSKLTDEEIAQLEGKAPYNPDRVTVEEAKRLYPEWHERVIVMGDKRPKKWNIKRDLYDWWLRRLRNEEEKIVPGHRYFCLLTLAIYAMKCNVSKEELARDAYSLLERMDKITDSEDNHFTVQDIEDALMGFNLWYCTFPRNSIRYLTGLEIKENRRNGRKQDVHLARIRALQNFDDPENKWRNTNGRPHSTADNSKIAALIKDWREQHPDNLNKSACARELELDRKTVRKWWEGDASAQKVKHPLKTSQNQIEITDANFEEEKQIWESTHCISLSKLFAPGSTYTLPGFTHEELVDELAQAYKEKGGATVPITLDEDVKKALDILRGGTKLPAKHLVSAIVRQFIDENKDRIGEAVMKNLD